ncbi:hypothetical protein HA466_0039510 [Hirschfeldia incana]|nr:hypothetical protein HA466_0039510 [Hirschfeldia incana]
MNIGSKSIGYGFTVSKVSELLPSSESMVETQDLDLHRPSVVPKPVVCDVDGTLGSKIGSFGDTKNQSVEEKGNDFKVQNSFPEPSRSDAVIGVKSMSVDSIGPSIRKRTKRIRRYTAEQIEERMTKGLCMFCDEAYSYNHEMTHTRVKTFVVESDEDSLSVAEMMKLMQMEDSESFAAGQVVKDSSCSKESTGQELILEKELVEKEIPEEILTPIAAISHQDNRLQVKSLGCGNDKSVHSHSDPDMALAIHHEVCLNMEEGPYIFTDVEAKSCAHKVFDKMILRRHKVHGKKKNVLAPKSWKFKFKKANPVKLLSKIQVINSLVELSSRCHMESPPLVVIHMKRKKFCWKNRSGIREAASGLMQCLLLLTRLPSLMDSVTGYEGDRIRLQRDTKVKRQCPYLTYIMKQAETVINSAALDKVIFDVPKYYFLQLQMCDSDIEAANHDNQVSISSVQDVESLERLLYICEKRPMRRRTYQQQTKQAKLLKCWRFKFKDKLLLLDKEAVRVLEELQVMLEDVTLCLMSFQARTEIVFFYTQMWLRVAARGRCDNMQRLMAFHELVQSSWFHDIFRVSNGTGSFSIWHCWRGKADIALCATKEEEKLEPLTELIEDQINIFCLEEGRVGRIDSNGQNLWRQQMVQVGSVCATKVEERVLLKLYKSWQFKFRSMFQVQVSWFSDISGHRWRYKPVAYGIVGCTRSRFGLV